MAETVSPGEIAHTLTHRHKAHGDADRRHELIEIGEAILLAMVAIATAWSGYQTARWDGRQAELYSLSSKYRALQTQASTLSGQLRLYDASTFGLWLQEHAHGNREAQMVFERRFRPEFRPAFRAWLRLDPFENANAPPGPMLMPQYSDAASERASANGRLATAAFVRGTEDRETADKYLRNTVLLATVLFLTALAQKFKLRKVRIGLLVVSGILLVVALAFVGSYPRA